MPRRMSVWPVAIHTRTPLEIGIIAATAPSKHASTPPSRRPTTQEFVRPRRARSQSGRLIQPGCRRCRRIILTGRIGASFFGSAGSKPHCRRQVNSWLAFRSCRRATWVIEAPSSRVSSMIRRFSSRVQDRRLRPGAAPPSSLPSDIRDSVRLY